MKVFQKTDSYAQNDYLEDMADPAQLEAAAYMHDVGMMFLPEGMWLNKLGRLNEDDKKALRAHPVTEPACWNGWKAGDPPRKWWHSTMNL